MLLANTQLNGYSLGLPLWRDGVEVSTGYIQGISITCRAPSSPNADTVVRLAKYNRTGNRLSMIFKLGDAPLCSLEASIPTQPTVEALSAESDVFIAGSVMLTPVADEVLVNLTDAVVNPKYIQFVPQTHAAAAYLQLGDHVSVPLVDLSVDSSTTAGVITSGGTATFYDDTQPSEIISRDVEHIYYINGSSVDTTGAYTLYLTGSGGTVDSGDWVVSSGGGLCARIGLNTNSPSCVDNNYIEASLSPANYMQPCPIDVAFSSSSGGSYKLNLAPILDGTIRFNSEYETVSGGLLWYQFSALHDIVSS